jgi:hypothetical protein
MKTVWKQDQTRVIKHSSGSYSLVHRGSVVMQGRFQAICRYLWREFLDA